MLVGIAQSIVTMIMNFKFRSIAEWTTNMENHRSQTNHNNSIFFKRFVFEFSDFLLYLFYIGLYQMDIQNLRTNLIALFWVDQIRRIITEAVIPYCT